MSDQHCTCEEIDHDECGCSLVDGDCVQVDGSGSVDNPFAATPIIDPDTDNLMSCAGDGLLAQLPSYILDPPRCQAYNNANQALTSDIPLVVALNSERYDSHSMHDTTTLNSRITFTLAGVYVVTFLCSFTANATGDRQALIRKNGQEFLGGSEKKAPSASFEGGMSVTVQEAFEVGEYVEAVVKQDGGSLNLLATRYSPILSVQFRRRSPY